MNDDIVLYKYKNRDLYCSALGGSLHFVSEKRMEDYLRVRKQVPNLTVLVKASELDNRISEFVIEQEVEPRTVGELITG